MTLAHRPRRRAIAALAVLSLLTLAVVPPVTTAAATPGCNVRNTTKGTAFGSMKKAVAAAAAGNRLELRGRCSGPITIGKNLTIVGVKTSATGTPTLTGNDMTRVLWIKEGAKVTLKKLVIRDGFRPADLTYPDSAGAGILLDGTATLVDVVVRDNVVKTAGTGAGGIEMQFTTSKLTLAGASVMTGNEGYFGGAIENYGTLVMKGSARIHHNVALESAGGVYDGGFVATVMSGTSRIDHNTAPSGGGMVLAAPGLTMSLGASIDNNTATVSTGGGIYNTSLGDLVNVTCDGTVHDNSPDDIAPVCIVN